MESFLIVIAIFFAVLLVFRYAVPPKKPKFGVCERLTIGALLMRIELLAKHCKTTSFGFGVSARALNACRNFVRIEQKNERGDCLYGYESAALAAKDKIILATNKAKAAARLSYTLKHVCGYPRIYLLCNEIVSGTSGDISKDILNNALISFEKHATLDEHEKRCFIDMMRYCLCVMLFNNISRMSRPSEIYSDGKKDGSECKVDLDRITNIYYVCGLLDGAVDDANAIENLLEINGVDCISAQDARSERISRVYAQTKCIIRSLDILEDYTVNINSTINNTVLSKRTVKFCKIAPPVVIFVLALFTCLFVPPRYAAICAVLSVLVYACFRLPILLYVPTENKGFKLNLPFLKFAQKKSSKSNIQLQERADAEIAYFGGEPEHIFHEFQSNALKILTDNRGNVSLTCKSQMEFSPFDVSIGVSDGKEVLDLTKADGAFEKHKSIFFACGRRMQMNVSVISPLDLAGVIFETTIINRTHEPCECSIGVVCTPKNRERGRAIRINGGVMYDNGIGRAALAFDRDGEYGCDVVSAICRDRYNLFEECEIIGMTGICKVSIRGFDKVVLHIAVVFGKSEFELKRLVEYALAKGYFDYADDNAREFSEYRSDELPATTNMPPVVHANIYEKVALYPMPQFDESQSVLKCGRGVFCNNGSYMLNANEYEPLKSFKNVLCDGYSYIECGNNGVSRVAFTDFNSDNNRVIDMPQAFVVIEENGVFWSPTNKPLGAGVLRVSHYIGYTDYECAYNGCKVRCRCFISHGRRAAYFELAIKNCENIARTFDIMFTIEQLLECDSYTVFSSERISERCEFKEGYFVYGSIDRVKDFRSGGQTRSPTVSVSKNVPPCTERKVLFCVTDGNESNSLITDCINECFERESNYFDIFKKIRLYSSDRELECLFAWSGFKAYTEFFACGVKTVKETAVYLGAMKYFDPVTVREILTDILSHQSINGKFEEQSVDGIFIFNIVFEIDDFINKRETIIDLPIPYATTALGGISVTECGTVKDHFLRAVFAYIDTICSEENNTGDTAKKICMDHAIIALLHKSIDLCSAEDKKKHKLIKALSRVASRYSVNLKQIRSQKFFNTESFYNSVICARALFLSGEHDKAYDILKNNNLITYAINAYDEDSTTLTFTEDDGKAFALYYTTVVEMFLGMKFHENKIKICPRMGKYAPLVALDMDCKGKTLHVDIDNCSATGEWKMRIGNISYSVNTLETDKPKSNNIILFRE